MKYLLIFALFTRMIWAETPTQVLEQFRLFAKQGDTAAALELIAKVEGKNPRAKEELDEKNRKIIGLFKSGWDIVPIKQHDDGEHAVVVVNEVKPNGKGGLNIDPVYLVSVGGKWKLVPSLSSWAVYTQYHPEAQSEFKVLEEWYKTHKTELRDIAREKKAKGS